NRGARRREGPAEFSRPAHHLVRRMRSPRHAHNPLLQIDEDEGGFLRIEREWHGMAGNGVTSPFLTMARQRHHIRTPRGRVRASPSGRRLTAARTSSVRPPATHILATDGKPSRTRSAPPAYGGLH